MVRTQRLELIINQSPSQEPLILVNGCVCVSVYLPAAFPAGTSAEAQHRRRRDSTRFQDQTKEKRDGGSACECRTGRCVLSKSEPVRPLPDKANGH